MDLFTKLDYSFGASEKHGTPAHRAKPDKAKLSKFYTDEGITDEEYKKFSVATEKMIEGAMVQVAKDGIAAGEARVISVPMGVGDTFEVSYHPEKLQPNPQTGIPTLKKHAVGAKRKYSMTTKQRSLAVSISESAIAAEGSSKKKAA